MFKLLTIHLEMFNFVALLRKKQVVQFNDLNTLKAR